MCSQSIYTLFVPTEVSLSCSTFLKLLNIILRVSHPEMEYTEYSVMKLLSRPVSKADVIVVKPVDDINFNKLNEHLFKERRVL